MKLLRLHLWREWREHRTTLLSLAIALPLLTLAITQPLSRRFVSDEVVQGVIALGFVLVALVGVGGELLGCERRQGGLRWLERLPAGLGTAFQAKLLLLLGSTAGAWGLGLATLALLAVLRGFEVSPGTLGDAWLALPVLAFVLWTFACSAWTLRGGMSVLCAALLVTLAGYPLLRAIWDGYQAPPTQVFGGAGALLVGALLGAWGAFVRGGRLGRGTGWALLHCCLPVVPLLALSSFWTLQARSEREVLDPAAEDFRIESLFVSEDGRFAILAAYHLHKPWDEPTAFALRVDLEQGSWEQIGRHWLGNEYRSLVDGRGLRRDAQFWVYTDDIEGAWTFDCATGMPLAAGAAPAEKTSWIHWGLGQQLVVGRTHFIRDPFRGRDYPLAALSNFFDLLVRPGAWLYCPEWSAPWSLLEPDTGAVRALDWEPRTRVLALLDDGRVVVAAPSEALSLVDPESGEHTPLPREHTGWVQENPDHQRLPGGLDPAGPPGTNLVVLRADWDSSSWLVIDPAEASVREWPSAGERELFVRALATDEALLVGDWRCLVRLDLRSGERELVFPRPALE